MRSTTSRTVALGVLIVVVVVLIMATGARQPTIAASAAMRQLAPRMRAIETARSTCVTDVVRATCTASDIVNSELGRAVRLQEGASCVAPRAACARYDGDVFIAELVSRTLPEIGGIRLEGRARRGETALSWTCRPTRATAPEALVQRACGDIPLA